MAKKSVEELDAELAALEAELSALEGAEPAPKKARKKERAPEPPAAEAPEGPAEPRKRFGLPARKPRAEAAPEPAPEAAPAAEDAPKRRLPFGRKKPAEEAPAPEPEEGRKLPFLGRKAEPEPELPAAPPPAPAEPALAWEQRGAGWRVQPPGAQRVEVVRREVDASGRILAEEQVGEEVVEPPPPPEEPRPSRFGLKRRELEPAPEAVPAGDGPPRRSRRKLLVIPVVLLLALLLLAVVLPALGVDPLGIGGVGGGAGPAPTAEFAVSANVVAVNAPVAFDARPSRDPSGGALEYRWDFGDGNGATGAQATHSYSTRSGTAGYTVTLTVRNAAGREATDTDVITVLPPPQARISPTFGGGPLGPENSPVAGEAVAFEGSGDAVGGITAFDWQFGDGARGTGASVTHAYASAGSYRVTLTVTDANGLRGNATAAVYVGFGQAVAGEAPASLQGAQAVNTTVPVSAGGSVLPFRPASLRVVLTYNATAPAPVPLPVPINPDNLGLTVYDAAGQVVATATGESSPKELVVTDFSGTLGDWVVSVTRPQGGAQPLPYSLEIRLTNGAA